MGPTIPHTYTVSHYAGFSDSGFSNPRFSNASFSNSCLSHALRYAAGAAAYTYGYT
jgi:hypothetical protein